MIKIISKNIGIISITALLLSYFDMFYYYNQFGLNITPYIEPTEIIFSFSWLYSVFIQFLLVTATVTIFKWLAQFDEKREPIAKALDEKVLRKQVYVAVSVIFTNIILGAPTLWYFLYTSKSIDITDADLLLYTFFVLSLFILAWYSISIIRAARTKTQGVQFGNVSWNASWNLVMIGLLIFSFLIIRNTLRANNILFGHARNSVTAITDKTIYKTTDSTLYIGSTQKYIFLFNIKSKGTVVI